MCFHVLFTAGDIYSEYLDSVLELLVNKTVRLLESNIEARSWTFVAVEKQ
jgi:hypothetical protein